MNKDVKRLLDIYKYPGLAFLLIATPGVNTLYFDQHALLTPIPGILLIYSLPLWVPYILFRLLRQMMHTQGAPRVADTPDRNPTLFRGSPFFRKYASLSFVLYLAMMYPLSHGSAASLNWGGIWGLRWKPHVFYKMSTFPVGFLLPPYGYANQETIDTMFLIAKDTLGK